MTTTALHRNITDDHLPSSWLWPGKAAASPSEFLKQKWRCKQPFRGSVNDNMIFYSIAGAGYLACLVLLLSWTEKETPFVFSSLIIPVNVNKVTADKHFTPSTLQLLVFEAHRKVMQSFASTGLEAFHKLIFALRTSCEIKDKITWNKFEQSLSNRKSKPVKIKKRASFVYESMVYLHPVTILKWNPVLTKHW